MIPLLFSLLSWFVFNCAVIFSIKLVSKLLPILGVMHLVNYMYFMLSNFSSAPYEYS